VTAASVSATGWVGVGAVAGAEVSGCAADGAWLETAAVASLALLRLAT
jgi:hypothetical protein